MHSARKDKLRCGLDTMYRVADESQNKDIVPKKPYPNNVSFFLGHEIVFEILKDLDPEKNFAGLHAGEFRQIFAKINRFNPEDESSLLTNVSHLLGEVDISNKNKQFLENFLHRCLTSKLTSTSSYLSNKKLWMREIDKEFAQR